MISSSDYSSFIKKTFADFNKTLNNQDFSKFSLLKNDFDRFEFVNNLLNSTYFNIQLSECKKSLPEAKELKEKGNSAFQAGDYKKALYFYNKSILKSPQEKENSELAIIRANRSAALYHLDKHQLALNDIEEALSNGYPKDMLYKLKDRKAKCLMALKQNKKGLEVLKETLTALDDAKIPLERRLKWQKDIQVMIALMIKNKVHDEKKKDITERSKQESFKKNQVYVGASDAIEIRQDKECGRYAVAARNINVGEVFLSEDPHCSVLMENQIEYHCYNCMRRTIAGEPCSNCDKVKFCSTKCQKISLKTHHLFECKILETLWKSGLSITCLMALRIMSQQNPKFFMNMKNDLMGTRDGEWTGKQYCSSDYLTVNKLVTHEVERSPEALLEKTLVAVYLTKCLKEVSYFENIPQQEEKDYLKLIGGLILRNLQLLQFNAHEVSELYCPKIDLSQSKSNCIGAALFPTLALFNHSCNPSLVRYFEGTRVFARAVRPIKKGEVVPENYGPIFTEMKKDARRKQLKERYWFDCECQACTENWPLFSQMDTASLRFRCDNTSCPNIIIVPMSTMEFMIQCTECGKHTNILKGLKALQDSENLFRLGTELVRTGEAMKATSKYTELLQLLDENLAPPFRDYHLCQQGLRTCFLTCGNICRAYQD